ncbi:MAG: DUF3800 domain-containing protein [Pseudomonadota bacterium]
MPHFQFYADESGTHDNSRILSVGGFLFEENSAVEFSHDWREQLKKRDIDYFRMSELTHPHNNKYSDWSDEELLKFEKSLIEAIATHALAGFAVSFSERDFSKVEFPSITGSSKLVVRSYSFCIGHILGQIRRWADTQGLDGDISYIFEAGHQHQGHANSYIGNVSREELRIAKDKALAGLKRIYRFHDYGFRDKSEALPLQAGDLLAWLWRNATQKRIDNKSERKDLIELRKVIYLKTDYLDRRQLEHTARLMTQLFRQVGL